MQKREIKVQIEKGNKSSNRIWKVNERNEKKNKNIPCGQKWGGLKTYEWKFGKSRVVKKSSNTMPFGSPCKRGKLSQVAGATIGDMLLFATLQYFFC